MELYIYGEIGIDVTPEMIRDKVLNSQGDITLRVQSPGGYVFDGYAIYNILKDSKRVKEAYIDGLCGSIATLIVNSAEKVYMSEVGQYMIHNPWSQVQGEAKDMIKEATTLNKIKDVLANVYEAKTNKPKELIEKMMDEESYMNAEEAKELGFIDEIVHRSKMVAKIHTNKSKMAENEKEVTSLMQEIKNMLASLVKSKPKNMALELENGTKVFVETEDGDLVGKEVYLANEDGSATQEVAPDGAHTLADGRVIQVSEGIITAVEEPEMEDVAAMKEKIKQMEDELAQYKEKEEANANALAEMEAKNQELASVIETKLAEVQNMVIGKADVEKAKDISKTSNQENDPRVESFKKLFQNKIK